MRLSCRPVAVFALLLQYNPICAVLQPSTSPDGKSSTRTSDWKPNNKDEGEDSNMLYYYNANLIDEDEEAELELEVEEFDANDNAERKLPRKQSKDTSGGLCVVGCTPYVDLDTELNGLKKYRALVNEMARTCDVIVHVGDTKPGHMPCMRNYLTKAVNILAAVARRNNKIALYAPGDNELNDCHRHKSKSEPVYSEINTASDARQHLIDRLRLSSPKDLTAKFDVSNHNQFSGSLRHAKIPGTNITYSCDFDKYLEWDQYAVATLEVIGSHWYLDDERLEGYPNQDEVDPIFNRLFMYLNAKDCAMEWIDETAKRASSGNKRAVFFMMHATFYQDFGITYLGSRGIGEFFKSTNLRNFTRLFGSGDEIAYPYQPLFDKLTEVAFHYPDIMFYVVHADGHRLQTIRMNPGKHNMGVSEPRLKSHHNLMLHQVEGASRSLTMYSRFTVDPSSFQPVTHKQEWSQRAYNIEPLGHSWIPYK